jgi:CHASE3 domain sensor protein
VRAADARENSYEVGQILDEVEKRLLDAETGQRGYLLTADETYLEPYHAATNNLGAAMSHLRDVTSNDPNQQMQVQNLDLLIQNKLGELQSTIDLRRRGETSEANQIVSQGSGKLWMDQIRGVITNMKNEAYELRSIRTQQMNAMVVETKRIIIVGYFLSFGLLALVFVLLDRELHERKRAQEALAKSEKWLATTLGSIGDG